MAHSHSILRPSIRPRNTQYPPDWRVFICFGPRIPCPAYLTDPWSRTSSRVFGLFLLLLVLRLCSIPPLDLHPPWPQQITSEPRQGAGKRTSARVGPRSFSSSSSSSSLLFVRCLFAGPLQLWACIPYLPSQITRNFLPPLPLPLPPVRQSAPSPLEWLRRTVSFELSQSVCRVPPRPSIESSASKRPHPSPGLPEGRVLQALFGNTLQDQIQSSFDRTTGLQLIAATSKRPSPTRRSPPQAGASWDRLSALLFTSGTG